jgi:cysteine synthase
MDETRQPLNPRMRHETTDINVWAVGKFGVALVIVTVVSLGLVFGLMKYFQSREENSVANTIQPTKLFPQPQLQQTPVLDLRAIRAEEEKLLTSYAWVDQPKGVVRIPVAQAIDILAKRGLPARTAPAATTEVPKQ